MTTEITDKEIVALTSITEILNRSCELKVKLQPATLTDFETIFDILYENAQWLEKRNIVQWPLWWLESQRDEIKESVAKGYFYRLEVESETESEVGNVIAAVVELRSSPEKVWQDDTAAALYVHKLAIRRQYSDQQLGRKVLGLIERYSAQKNLNCLRLDCVAHNLKLRQYYESYGFKLITEVDTPEVVLALYELNIELNIE